MDIGRRCLAEFIGTFAIVFVGVASISVANGRGGNLLTVALAFGFVVAVMVSATLHISGGQFNPAVSIALLATGKMNARDVLAYVGAQLAGATAAAFLLVALFGHDAVAAGTPLVTERPAAEVQAATGAADAVGSKPGPIYLTRFQGLVMEVILTFLLVFVIFGTAVDRRGPKVMAGLMIGLTVTLDILFGGPYTGASMNPARSFGPALASGTWTGHWVYWVGPIVGGALAAVLYNTVFLAPAKTATAADTQDADSARRAEAKAV